MKVFIVLIALCFGCACATTVAKAKATPEVKAATTHVKKEVKQETKATVKHMTCSECCVKVKDCAAQTKCVCK